MYTRWQALFDYIKDLGVSSETKSFSSLIKVLWLNFYCFTFSKACIMYWWFLNTNLFIIFHYGGRVRPGLVDLQRSLSVWENDIKSHKWATTDDCLVSDEQHLSFDNMKKQLTRNFPFASNTPIVRLAAAVKLSETRPPITLHSLAAKKALGQHTQPRPGCHWTDPANSEKIRLSNSLSHYEKVSDWICSSYFVSPDEPCGQDCIHLKDEKHTPKQSRCVR